MIIQIVCESCGNEFSHDENEIKGSCPACKRGFFIEWDNNSEVVWEKVKSTISFGGITVVIEKPFTELHEHLFLPYRKLLSLLLLLVTFSISNAAIVYETKFRSQAKEIVYITTKQSEATHIIRKTEHQSQANQKDWWYFTTQQSQANLIIFYTTKRSEATMVVYFL